MVDKISFAGCYDNDCCCYCPLALYFIVLPLSQDIPAHVANTPHPNRRSMNSSTAVTPRSTSAPSQYDLHPTTPSHRRDTPVQMILTGNKKLMRGIILCRVTSILIPLWLQLLLVRSCG